MRERDLFAAFRETQAKELPADAPELIKLSEKRESLIAEFTGGDPEILASLGRMWSSEPSVAERYGATDVMGYMSGASTETPSTDHEPNGDPDLR